MVTLIRLARASITYLVKGDEAEIGRSPTIDVLPTASPGVPSEEPKVLESPVRSSREVIRDAISVLEEGLRVEGEGVPGADRQEVMSTVEMLRKAVRGEDIPISVKAIIKDHAGRMLVLRDAYSDYWDLPGGHVQEGEILEAALRREVQEEIGLSVGACHQVDTRLLELNGKLRPILFYSVEYIGGQPRCSEEHLGYQWASQPELSRLNLGVFKKVLIPGPDEQENLEVGYLGTNKLIGATQIPQYQAKEDGGGGVGIAGPGDSMVGEDSYTPTGGRGKKKLELLAPAQEVVRVLSKIGTGGGHFVTGDQFPTMPAGERTEIRPVNSEVAKLVKGLSTEQLIAAPDLRIISKAQGGKPFIVAGYASPVIVDLEGHRVSHRALVEDVPRFMALGGKYANLNIAHSNCTVGHLISEFTAADGQVYRTGVDQVGFFAVAEIRTDPYAPDIIQKVIEDIETGKLRSFSISGNAGNPVFTCDEKRCFYDIDKVNLFEITLCAEGVNPEAKFEVISK